MSHHSTDSRAFEIEEPRNISLGLFTRVDPSDRLGGRFLKGTPAVEILFLNMLSTAIVGQIRNSL